MRGTVVSTTKEEDVAAPPKLRFSHVFRRALATATALILIGAPAAWAQLPGDGTGGVGDAVGDVGSGTGDTVGDVGTGVGDAVGDVTDGDNSGGSQSDGGLDDVVEDVGNGAGDTVEEIGGGVGNAIDETAGDAGQTLDDTTGTVGGQVGGTVGGISIPGGELILGGKGKKDEDPSQTVPFQGSISAADAVLGLPEANAPTITAIKEPLPKEPPYSTTAAPPGDDQSVIERLAQAAAEAAKRFAFPLALSLVVGGFLMLQNRLDNRDRKLALAPVDAEQDLLSFK